MHNSLPWKWKSNRRMQKNICSYRPTVTLAMTMYFMLTFRKLEHKLMSSNVDNQLISILKCRNIYWLMIPHRRRDRKQNWFRLVWRRVTTNAELYYQFILFHLFSLFHQPTVQNPVDQWIELKWRILQLHRTTFPFISNDISRQYLKDFTYYSLHFMAPTSKRWLFMPSNNKKKRLMIVN